MTRKEFCPICKARRNFVYPSNDKKSKILMCDTCHFKFMESFFDMNDTQLFLLQVNTSQNSPSVVTK